MTAENLQGKPLASFLPGKPGASGNLHPRQGSPRRGPYVDAAPANFRVVESGPTLSPYSQLFAAGKGNGPKAKERFPADPNNAARPFEHKIDLRRDAPEVILISDDEGSDGQGTSVLGPSTQLKDLGEQVNFHQSATARKHSARLLAQAELSCQKLTINQSGARSQVSSTIPAAETRTAGLSWAQGDARPPGATLAPNEQSLPAEPEYLYPNFVLQLPPPAVHFEPGIGSGGVAFGPCPLVGSILPDTRRQRAEFNSSGVTTSWGNEACRVAPPAESRTARVAGGPILSFRSGGRSTPGAPYPGPESRLAIRCQRDPPPSRRRMVSNEAAEPAAIVTSRVSALPARKVRQSRAGAIPDISSQTMPPLAGEPPGTGTATTSLRNARDQESQVGALLPFFSSRSTDAAVERQPTECLFLPSASANGTRRERLTAKEKANRFRASLAAFSRRGQLDQVVRSGRPVLFQALRCQTGFTLAQSAECRRQDNCQRTLQAQRSQDVIEILDSDDEGATGQARRASPFCENRRPGLPRDYDTSMSYGRRCGGEIPGRP